MSERKMDPAPQAGCHMEYARLPQVEKPVSRIFYGTAAEPYQSGGDGKEILDAMLALGVNTFDTARQYGYAENSLGDWIESRQNRERLVLLSKCCHHIPETGEKRVSEKEMRKDLEMSLSCLKTDHIDIYILHRDDPDVPVAPIVETFNDLHAKGKIGAFGGSNWTHRRIEEANEYAYQHNLIPFALSSPNFGLAEQITDPWGGGALTISGAKNKDARAWYQKTQLAVAAHSSLGRGLFSGRLKSSDYESAARVMDVYAMKGFHCPENFERLRRCEILALEKGVTVPQIALSWIFRQGINTFAVVSTGSPARMQANIDALHLDLSEAECLYLNLERDTY